MNEELENIDFENPKQDDKRTIKPSGVGKSVYDLLGGTFLANKRTRKLYPFIFYIAFLAFLYIGNTYLAERKIRRMDEIQDNLKELRYEYINTKSDLMSETKQSTITKKLEKEGLKESTVPPKQLVIEK